MNDISSRKPASAPTLQDGIDTMLGKMQDSVRHCVEDCEEHVRRSPTASVLTAAAVGYCLHQLPVRSLIVAQVRLLSALLPPALFLFGAAKVYEFFQQQAGSSPSSGSER